MPPGFGILDTLLVSLPIFLAILGLIRGAPVEFASCLGCLAGIAAAWAVSNIPVVHDLGQPASPLIALASGVIAWRLMRGISDRFGFDTRWIDLGRLFDSFAGFSMGGLRGVALVSAGCLAYAVVLVPLGLANPLDTVAYPVFLSVGSQVTSAVIAKLEPQTASQPETAEARSSAGSTSFASVPLPMVMPQIPGPAAPSAVATGLALASLMHAVAPSAIAATMAPLPRGVTMPAYHPDIPVRGVPVSLIETHHNLLHPRGMFVRHAVHH
jgi:hypothetical protein